MTDTARQQIWLWTCGLIGELYRQETLYGGQYTKEAIREYRRAWREYGEVMGRMAWEFVPMANQGVTMDITDVRVGSLVKGPIAGVGYRVCKLETVPERTCDDCSGYGSFTVDPTEDDEPCTHCDGCGTLPDELTGRVIVCMVGDDYRHAVDAEDIEPIDPDDVCECGQVGCHSPNAMSGAE